MTMQDRKWCNFFAADSHAVAEEDYSINISTSIFSSSCATSVIVPASAVFVYVISLAPSAATFVWNHSNLPGQDRLSTTSPKVIMLTKDQEQAISIRWPAGAG